METIHDYRAETIRDKTREPRQAEMIQDKMRKYEIAKIADPRQDIQDDSIDKRHAKTR